MWCHAAAEPCPTCGLFSIEDCCDLCLRQNKFGAVCDTAELWHQPGETRGYRCALKQFSKRLNLTANTGRTYVRVTHEPSTPREYTAAVVRLAQTKVGRR